MENNKGFLPSVHRNQKELMKMMKGSSVVEWRYGN